MAECRDSASTVPSFPALTVALLSLTSPEDARRITEGSGVGRARRDGARDAAAAAGGEQGGKEGREGLEQGGGEEAGVGGASTRAASSTLKVLESQDSFT